MVSARLAPKVVRGSGLIFSRKMCPETNSENFTIFQSHNKLQASILRVDHILKLDLPAGGRE
jgi:hypothetical protein